MLVTNVGDWSITRTLFIRFEKTITKAFSNLVWVYCEDFVLVLSLITCFRSIIWVLSCSFSSATNLLNSVSKALSLFRIQKRIKHPITSYCNLDWLWRLLPQSQTSFECNIPLRPCKIDSETFFGIFFVSVLYDCISVTYIGGCDRFW